MTDMPSSLQLAQQFEDLRLDGDVERGGRLVGDQQPRLGRRSPSRSSPAAACRRTADADIRRRAARRRESAPAPSSSIARLRAAAASRPWCRRSVSAIWSPIVSTGLSDDIGSWKIIAISLPRIARICRGARQQVLPLIQDRAARHPRGGALVQPQDRERGDALAAAGFADDADAIPPASTSSETSSIAVTQPLSTRNWTVRLRMREAARPNQSPPFRRGSSISPSAVAEQIEAQCGEADGDAGKQHHPPGLRWHSRGPRR